MDNNPTNPQTTPQEPQLPTTPQPQAQPVAPQVPTNTPTQEQPLTQPESQPQSPIAAQQTTTPVTQAPAQPNQTEQATPQAPLQPQAPLTTQQTQQPTGFTNSVPLGWTLVGVSAFITIIGFFFGYALAPSALIAAFAGRVGLRNKNKPLTICALILAGLNLLLLAIALLS